MSLGLIIETILCENSTHEQDHVHLKLRYILASLLHLDQSDTDNTENDSDLIYSRETFLKIQNSHENDDDEIDNSDDGYGFRQKFVLQGEGPDDRREKIHDEPQNKKRLLRFDRPFLQDNISSCL